MSYVYLLTSGSIAKKDNLQHSLFVADLEQTSLQTLKENLILISGKSKTNNISIIPICQNCYSKLWQIGNPKETHRSYVIA